MKNKLIIFFLYGAWNCWPTHNTISSPPQFQSSTSNSSDSVIHISHLSDQKEADQTIKSELLNPIDQFSSSPQEIFILQDQISEVYDIVKKLFKFHKMHQKIDDVQDFFIQLFFANAVYQFGDRESKNYVKKWINQSYLQKFFQKNSDQLKKIDSIRNFIKKWIKTSPLQSYLEYTEELIPFSMHLIFEQSKHKSIIYSPSYRIKDTPLEVIYEILFLKQVPNPEIKKTGEESYLNQFISVFDAEISQIPFQKKLIFAKALKGLSPTIVKKIKEYVEQNDSIFLNHCRQYFNDSYVINKPFDALYTIYLCYQIGGKFFLEAQNWFQLHKDQFIENVKNFFKNNEKVHLLTASLCLCFQVPGDNRLQQLAKNYLKKFEDCFKKHRLSRDEFNTWTLNLASLLWFHFFDIGHSSFLASQALGDEQNTNTQPSQIKINSNFSSSIRAINENFVKSFEDSFVIGDRVASKTTLVLQNQFSIVHKKIKPLLNSIYVRHQVLEGFQNLYDSEQDSVRKEELRMTQYVIAYALHQFGNNQSKNYVKKWINQIPIKKNMQKTLDQFQSSQYFSKMETDSAYPEYMFKIYHNLIPFSLNALLEPPYLGSIELQLENNDRLKFMYKIFLLKMVSSTHMTQWIHQMNHHFFSDFSKLDFFEKLIAIKTYQGFSNETRIKMGEYEAILLEDCREFLKIYGLDAAYVLYTLQVLYFSHQIGGQIWFEVQAWFQSHKDHLIKNVRYSFTQNESENLTIASLCLCFLNEDELQNLARNYINQLMTHLKKNESNPSEKPVETFTDALMDFIWTDLLK